MKKARVIGLKLQNSTYQRKIPLHHPERKGEILSMQKKLGLHSTEEEDSVQLKLESNLRTAEKYETVYKNLMQEDFVTTKSKNKKRNYMVEKKRAISYQELLEKM